MIANGQTLGGNSVGLDGAANNDDSSGTGAGGQVRVPLESVSEFQVLTNQFDAEFGRTRGAIVNAITKQGTNLFSGAVYGYFTGDSTTAEDFFVAQSATLDKPETDKKEVGGYLVVHSSRTRCTSSSAPSDRWSTQAGRATTTHVQT